MQTIEQLEQQFEFKPTSSIQRSSRRRNPNSTFQFVQTGMEAGNWRGGKTQYPGCSCRAAGCSSKISVDEIFFWGSHMPHGQKTLCVLCYLRLIAGFNDNMPSNSRESENNNKIFSLVQ